ncbi:MAG: flagellar protein FliS [bacterium]|nr:flagellar protein FliS [bacterium]
MKEQINTYRQVDTAGKSQIDLILQVYSGAIQGLKTGRELYAAGKLNEGYEQVEKARKCIVHLYTTLDFEQGGEVASNLGQLYTFMMGELDLIEATKDLTKLDSCLRVMDNLRQGWEQLKQDRRTTKPVTEQMEPVESLLVSA